MLKKIRAKIKEIAIVRKSNKKNKPAKKIKSKFKKTNKKGLTNLLKKDIVALMFIDEKDKHCHKLEEEINANIIPNNDEVAFVKVDVKEKSIFGSATVSFVPTLMFFYKGNIVEFDEEDRLEGYSPEIINATIVILANLKKKLKEFNKAATQKKTKPVSKTNVTQKI